VAEKSSKPNVPSLPRREAGDSRVVQFQVTDGATYVLYDSGNLWRKPHGGPNVGVWRLEALPEDRR